MFQSCGSNPCGAEQQLQHPSLTAEARDECCRCLSLLNWGTGDQLEPWILGRPLGIFWDLSLWCCCRLAYRSQPAQSWLLPEPPPFSLCVDREWRCPNLAASISLPEAVSALTFKYCIVENHCDYAVLWPKENNRSFALKIRLDRCWAACMPGGITRAIHWNGEGKCEAACNPQTYVDRI